MAFSDSENTLIPKPKTVAFLVFFIFLCGLINRQYLVNTIGTNVLAIHITQTLMTKPGCNPILLDIRDFVSESDSVRDRFSMGADCNAGFVDFGLGVYPSRMTGILLISQGRYSSAIDELKRTNEYSAGGIFVRYLLGISAWRNKDHSSAVEFWTGIGVERLWLMEGWACAVRNDPCAISFAELALAVSPTNTDVIRDYGRYEEAHGRKELAIVAYSRVLSMNCQSYICNILIGHMYRLQSRWEDAINHYSMASQINPLNGESYYLIAGVLINQCNLSRALSIAERGQLVDPGYGWNAYFIQRYTTGIGKQEYDTHCGP